MFWAFGLLGFLKALLGAVRDILFTIDTLHLADDLLILAGDNLLDFSLSGFLVRAYAQVEGVFPGIV